MIKIKRNEKIQENIQFEKPLVLIGFPGIAMVGKFAMLSLIEQYKAETEPIFWAYYDDMPAQAMVSLAAKMRLPRTTFYCIAGDKRKETPLERDVIIITSDDQPVSSGGIYYFADFICKKCKEFGAEEIIATGAFVPEHITPGERIVHVSGTSERIIDFFLESETKLTKLMNGGYIAGANGVTPAWGHIHYDMEGACLLAEAFPMLQRDPRASKSIFAVLNERYKLNADLSNFDKEIEEIEAVSNDLQKYLKNKSKTQLKTQQNYYG
ncbi:MAG: PAC2 family protein [Candidatus Helarchaeota archaeon]